MDKEIFLSMGKPQKVCVNCNQPIDRIERHPSILKAGGESEIQRLDFCPACWSQMKDEVYESFWITRRVVKEQKLNRLTRRERNVALRALFESLWERREEEDVGPHLFFLAHLMLKWGGLKWKENRVDAAGREVVVFEDPATGDPLEVSGVDVTEERTAAIKDRIEEFLRQYSPEDEVVL